MYTNSILASLNARKILRRRNSLEEFESTSVSSPVGFNIHRARSLSRNVFTDVSVPSLPDSTGTISAIINDLDSSVCIFLLWHGRQPLIIDTFHRLRSAHASRTLSPLLSKASKLNPIRWFPHRRKRKTKFRFYCTILILLLNNFPALSPSCSLYMYYLITMNAEF